jgi:glutathione S-transferase
MVTLYVDSHWISPYAFSCFVALREKGVEFEARPVSLPDREHHVAEYRDRSLTGRVPALDHDGFWLAESSAIDEYIEETFPGPRLYPEGPRERARARQVQAWLRSDLLPIREERPTTSIWYQRAEAPLSPAGQAAAERLLRAADQLVERPSGMFGAWCIADSDLAVMLQRLALNGHDLGAKLQTYALMQWERPSVVAWNEQPRPAYRGY